MCESWPLRAGDALAGLRLAGGHATAGEGACATFPPDKSAAVSRSREPFIALQGEFIKIMGAKPGLG